jgi:hypothetical protein
MLLSEDELQHSSAQYLEASAENGCPFCRMLWLQDPNPDVQRLTGEALTLFGVTGEQGEYDLKTVGFTSELDQFRLDISVSASEGMCPRHGDRRSSAY